ncbi:hypothetical protein Tco_1330255 [Tanacetum coccineum]
MRELREDTFSRNKNDDVHEHVERILDIVSLFNNPGVTQDAIMLRVFPIALTGAVKRWVDRLPSGTINTCDLLKKAFIQRYCPPPKTAKQLEEIHNFTYQNVNIFYKGLDTMTCQLLDLQGPIPNKTPTQALDAIQTTADHSQKWHDGSTSRKVNNGRLDGIAAIISKLDSLGRDIKKLKENVDAIKIGYKTCRRAHLNKECLLHEEVKRVEEVNFSNEEVQEETKEVEEIEVVAAHHEPTYHKVTPSNLPIVSYYVAPYEPAISFPRRLEKHAKEALVHKTMESLKRIKNQLPPKEQDLGSFILPYSIGKLTFNTLANLGASISIMPLLMFKRLGIEELKPKNMVIEMADRTKITPKGIVENLLIKIDKFIFPIDFMILDMVEYLKIPIILERPLLVTDHAEVDVLRKSISIEVWDQKIRAVKEPNKERDIDLSPVVKLKEHWCKAILQQKGDRHEFWASCDPYDDQRDGGSLPDDTRKKGYWCCLNDDKRLDRQELDENQEYLIYMNFDLTQAMNPNTEEDCEDLENFGEENMELILDTVLENVELLWSSGGDSGPDMSFDKSASPERLFSLARASLAGVSELYFSFGCSEGDYTSICPPSLVSAKLAGNFLTVVSFPPFPINSILHFTFSFTLAIIEPTMALFRVFQTLCKQGDWFSFSKHHAPSPVCIDDNPSSIDDPHPAAGFFAWLMSVA